MNLAATLSNRLDATRARTYDLYAPLGDDLAMAAPAPFMSPPVWDLGHIAAYEELWLVQRLAGQESLHPDLQLAYDAFETPRAKRTEVELLDAAACRRYLDHTRDRALDALHSVRLDDDAPELTRGGAVFEMVAQHEAQHTETVLQTLKLFPPGTYRPPNPREVPEPCPAGDRWVHIPGGDFELGAGPSGFAYDCERPRHRRTVEPFWLDRVPVSNERHLEFMGDGGYTRSEFWSDAGWRWRQSQQVEAPLFWEKEGSGWTVRDYSGVVPLDPTLPVCHVSWFEADAHARWAGGRLPTEAEWEFVASPDGRSMPWGDGWSPRMANLDQTAFGPYPVGSLPDGASVWGCEQMLGDVWEWTSTAFGPYPGFRAFPYPEYAEVFFGGDYYVLRGGSWATQPSAARASFRNWDHPYRRQIFAGFRIARDAA
jgi:gamma-glutamyl hercynylcysteine S-oxide synthase